MRGPLREVLTGDLEANGRGVGASGLGLRSAARVIPTVRFLAVVLFRLSQAAHRRRSLRPLGLVLKQLNHLLTGLDAAPDVAVGAGLMLFHPTGVVIGPGATIGERCVIQSSVVIGGLRGYGRGTAGAPTIGADVFIGSGAKILGDVTIAGGSVVGANAVVVRDVGPGAQTVVGVPARVVQKPPTSTDPLSGDSAEADTGVAAVEVPTGSPGVAGRSGS